MRYIDEKKKEEVKAEVGDFIFADGDLFVIYKRVSEYQAIYMTGQYAFVGAGITEKSIEEIVNFFKQYDDFELIKSDEMELIRRGYGSLKI